MVVGGGVVVVVGGIGGRVVVVISGGGIFVDVVPLSLHKSLISSLISSRVRSSPTLLCHFTPHFPGAFVLTGGKQR